jgi:integral membrane sensor domain MASE1
MVSRVLATAGACLTAAEVARLATVTSPGGWELPAVALAPGILLAALIRSGRRQWPLLVACGAFAMVLSATFHGQSLFRAAAYAALATTEAVVAAFVIGAIASPLNLARMGHVLSLIVTATVVPLMVGSVAAETIAQSGAANFMAALRAWYFASSLGLLLGSAAAVAAIDIAERRDRLERSRYVEAVLVIVAAAVLAELVFSGRLPPVLRVPALMLPAFLWAAFRLNVGGAAATILATAIIGLWHTALGEGPFLMANATPDLWLLRAQSTAFVAGSSMLLFAGVDAERKQIARERAALLAELQEAGAEIKTLRGMIPICAWCHKVRDDAGFWQGLETYVHDHTDATLSHGICPECTSRMHGELKAHSS